jgi:ABC-2 type transport system ATP-binding protein
MAQVAAYSQQAEVIVAPRAELVRVHDLHKRYGQTQALAGLSLEVRPGELLAILGPNGAGKTTLIEILEGLRPADSGTATVLGANVRRKHGLRPVLHRIGVGMQKTVLPRLLTVSELLRMYASLYPHPRSPSELIARVHLADKRDAKLDGLSGGQVQRLAVALALVGDPEILFLDEPTSQLDPQARRAVWELLTEQLARKGGAILLTTHQMEEAQQLATRVAIIDHGKIIALGTPSELIAQSCPDHVLEFTTTPDAVLDGLGDRIVVDRTPLGPGTAKARLTTPRLEQVMERLMAARAAGRFVVEDVRMERQTLEDVFLKLTGRRIRD